MLLNNILCVYCIPYFVYHHLIDISVYSFLAVKNHAACIDKFFKGHKIPINN